MKTRSCLLSAFAALLFGAAFIPATSGAQASLSAADLAARLRPVDGNAYVRLRMEHQGRSLQIQAKERRSRSGTDIVYQILFPKERKGEAVLLRKAAGRAPSGTLFVPPETVRPIGAGQMGEGIFGSDLAYEDIIDSFFAWPSQALVGTEAVGRITCHILESKPGKGERSSYGSVRTWVDTRRMVPLRVEKYNASGKLVRRIETTRVANDDLNRIIPATLRVTGSGSGTELEGSKIKHGVAFDDREFTPEGLREVSPARSAPD